MKPIRFLLAACLLALAALAGPAAAQQAAVPAVSRPAPAPMLRTRLDQLVTLLNGRGDYTALFSPAFRHAIPQAQFQTYADQLKAQGGTATAVEELVPATPYSGAVTIAYQRSTVTMEIAVDPAPPHQIAGLRITGSVPRGDTLAKLQADFRALPGASGFGIYALNESVRPVIEYNGAQVAPLGSAFKLWMLAEAAREVGAGERHWSDVIRVGRHSLPSGMLQGWPDKAPITLQTAATLMISISDNTAADTLLTTLGRDKVGAMVKETGVADPDRTLPLITTMEAFALKSPANADLGRTWASATTPDARGKLLADNATRLDGAKIDPNMFGSTPLAIDSVEWFASPRDMAHVLDWLRLHGDDTTRAILAVNAGTDPTTKKHYDYVGFKGGSEPGVITLNYLVRDKAGTWFAVTGNWHNPQAALNDLTFASLMNRALLLAR